MNRRGRSKGQGREKKRRKGDGKEGRKGRRETRGGSVKRRRDVRKGKGRGGKENLLSSSPLSLSSRCASDAQRDGWSQNIGGARC